MNDRTNECILCSVGPSLVQATRWKIIEISIINGHLKRLGCV